MHPKGTPAPASSVKAQVFKHKQLPTEMGGCHRLSCCAAPRPLPEGFDALARDGLRRFSCFGHPSNASARGALLLRSLNSILPQRFAGPNSALGPMDDSPDDTVQLDAPELTRPVDRLVRTFSWRARQKAKKTDPSASERADDVPDDATAAAPEDLGRTLTRVLSFGRRNKQARQSDDGGKDDEDLDRTTSMFSGPRRAFSLTRRPAASAGTRFSALRLSETEHVYGPLQVRRAEKRGQKPAPRYCVLGKETCVLTWYATASTEAPSNGQRPDGSCTIALADGAPATPDLFHAFECRAASAEEAARWKRSLDAITSRAISGYIQIKGRRGWKRRWVLFQPLCKKLCIYRAQPLVAHSAGTFADAHIYQQPGYRAHGEVKWAARRPSPSQPFGFSIFTPDEGQWELAAPTAKEMRRWLDSLPIFDPEAANIVNAIGEEYHAEKERRQSVRLSLRSSVSSSAPTSPARESPASSPAKVGAGAKSAAEPAPLAEVSDSASESDDDDDADSAAAEAPKPLQLGISGRDLVTHAKPGSAAAAGAITPRSNRLVSDQLRQLEEMRQQLEALRNENRELKLQTGGELSADQDEKVLQEFLVKLRAVLEMRSEGRSMKKYWAALSNGEGDVSEVRRFRRKPELGLLVSSTEDIKKISPYNWRNMGCSGLTEQELRCLLVRLGEPGMPGQADEFKKMIIARLGTKSPTDAQEKQEARMRAIEAGEIEVEDPREKRLRELKENKPAKPGKGAGGKAAPKPKAEKQEARMRAIEAGEIEVEDPREKRLQELKKQKAAEAAAKKKSAKAAAAKK
ncbi:hypothetical protein EMIHUDRAFT_457891 [Emiliania huxleyi CCMP1516]|uniref:PH domain-containing protein n=2 Tax=Emiliania huxleyi TaxID=2903 RepID=A0A0D3JJS0_EMIH1|nr:hypothetical protein EMIHUDRAFT_457891 [Emiliania huxleyi CCMP1516]EOD23755.1 hypothetical protein EMIHUDRAFT_457891 [Emiliania huxleyi CCMP1516]|eukprot:XP_005776184.1 hypothetical protein EMIHUDRAFT_457891 [Emiliania huxleyi CCMP1516]